MTDFHQDLNFGISINNDKKEVAENPVENKRQNLNSPPYVPDHEAAEKAADSTGNLDLKKAAHPGACIATFGFKLGAILIYLVLGYFLPKILTFILVIIMTSIDFWVVKNITGRLLVGLRWWSEKDQNGKQLWRFESPLGDRNNNKVDKTFFWLSQIVVTVLWGLFFLINFLSFSILYCLLLFICCSLSFTNLYGFYQCRGDHQKKVTDLRAEYGKKGLMHLAGSFL